MLHHGQPYERPGRAVGEQRADAAPERARHCAQRTGRGQDAAGLGAAGDRGAPQQTSRAPRRQGAGPQGAGAGRQGRRRAAVRGGKQKPSQPKHPCPFTDSCLPSSRRPSQRGAGAPTGVLNTAAGGSEATVGNHNGLPRTPSPTRKPYPSARGRTMAEQQDAKPEVDSGAMQMQRAQPQVYGLRPGVARPPVVVWARRPR